MNLSLIKCIHLNSPWNVLLSHLNGQWTIGERWAHSVSVQTVSARWTNLASVYERWMLSECRAQTECKCKCDIRYVYAMWRQNERFIRSASGVILSLCFISNQEKITNKFNVCFVISLNIISSDQRLVNAEWTARARWTLCEHTASALIVNGECEWTGVESASERTVNTRWAHVKMGNLK